MSNNTKDNEILSDGQKINALVQSEEWKLVKDRLFLKLNDLNSLRSTMAVGKTPEDLMREFNVRTAVIDLVLEWIGEIEGTAIQAQQLYDLEKKDDNYFIKNY